MWPAEGLPATYNPRVTGLVGDFPLQAAPGGVTLGRFGWADVKQRLVSNVYTAGFPIGIVQPVCGGWGRQFYSNCAWVLREGLNAYIETLGDFWLRFADGVNVGNAIWANPADGSAWAADQGGYRPTVFRAATCAAPGDLAIISSWNPPLSS